MLTGKARYSRKRVCSVNSDGFVLTCKKQGGTAEDGSFRPWGEGALIISKRTGERKEEGKELWQMKRR
jgi:hypothetical protein